MAGRTLFDTTQKCVISRKTSSLNTMAVQSAVSKHINVKLSGRKCVVEKGAQATGIIAALGGLWSKASCRMWGRFTRHLLQLRPVHQPPQHPSIQQRPQSPIKGQRSFCIWLGNQSPRIWRKGLETSTFLRSSHNLKDDEIWCCWHLVFASSDELFGDAHFSFSSVYFQTHSIY